MKCWWALLVQQDAESALGAPIFRKSLSKQVKLCDPLHGHIRADIRNLGQFDAVCGGKDAGCGIIAKVVAVLAICREQGVGIFEVVHRTDDKREPTHLLVLSGGAVIERLIVVTKKLASIDDDLPVVVKLKAGGWNNGADLPHKIANGVGRDRVHFFSPR
jgi:hypothetical protein